MADGTPGWPQVVASFLGRSCGRVWFNMLRPKSSDTNSKKVSDVPTNLGMKSDVCLKKTNAKGEGGSLNQRMELALVAFGVADVLISFESAGI